MSSFVVTAEFFSVWFFVPDELNSQQTVADKSYRLNNVNVITMKTCTHRERMIRNARQLTFHAIFDFIFSLVWHTILFLMRNDLYLVLCGWIETIDT